MKPDPKEKLTPLELAQREIQIVNEIIRSITGKGGFDEVMQVIVDKSLSFLNTDRIGISLVNRETRMIDGFWLSGLPFEVFRAKTKGCLSLDKNYNDIAVQALREKKPMILEDALNDPRATKEIVEISGIKSCAILPLIVGDEAIGFFSFETLDPERPFKYEDVPRYQRFVDTLSLFFHNARLYDRLEEWNDTLEQRVVEKTRELTEAHEFNFRIKENLAAIVENSTSGVIATNLEGKIDVFNKTARQIFRRTLSEIPKGRLGTLFPERVFQSLWQSLTTPPNPKDTLVIRNSETELLGADGSPVPVNLSAIRLLDRHDNPFSYLLILQDLREIRFLEGQVLQGEKLKVLGQMSAGMFHEINTPLGMIKGSLAVIRQSGSRDPSILEKHLRFIEEAVERGTRFAGELLSFSKPAALHLRELCISDCLGQALDIVRVKNQESRPEFVCETGPQIPTVYGDLQALVQVLTNLLDNSVSASPPGSGIRIEVGKSLARPDEIFSASEKGRRSDDSPARDFSLFRKPQAIPPDKLPPLTQAGDEIVLVRVIDHGVGMSPEVAKRVFEPFFSLNKKSGTGLGLAIVEFIVKRHQGAIEIQSEEGRGTTMILKLPTYQNHIRFERMP